MNNIESKEIKELFAKYFENRNCSDLHIIENENSRIDFLIKSASTINIICEIKKRSMPSFKYYTSILELQKYNSLKLLSEHLSAPAFYICSYEDVTLIFQIDFTKKYTVDSFVMQKSNYGHEQKVKEIIHLNNVDSDYIISKKTWNNGSPVQYKEYFDRNYNQ
jgi:hypothetical protein